MKKAFLVISIISIIVFLTGCPEKKETAMVDQENQILSVSDDSIRSEIVNVSKSNNSEEKIKVTNVLESTYTEGKSDGYSWRLRECNYDINDLTLSKEKLVSTRWDMDDTVNQYVIMIFYIDDVFKIGTPQAGVGIQGKYRIENDTVVLYEYNNDDGIGISYTLPGKEIICPIYFNSDNVFFKHELLINGIKYFPRGSEKTAGDKAILDGYNVNIVSQIKVFNDAVKFRTAPSISSETQSVYLYNEISDGKIKSQSFKKGTIVNVLAETDFKETIDDVTAPWCYIKVNDGFEGFQLGWVFGAYFDSYDTNKVEEYYDVLFHELGIVRYR